MKIDFDKSGAQSIRKAAYCHTHTPADEAAGMQSALSGVYVTGDTDDDTSRCSFKNRSKSHAKSGADKNSVNETEFKEKIRKTRKILAEKRSELPKVSIPTIPPDRLTTIAEKVRLPKRNQFIQRLLGYWTLKRQSRNGVPLLRRLQISYMGNRRAETFDTDSEHVRKTREVVKYVQRLRQDLEKARLLVELIRKREKLKRQLIEAQQEETEFRMIPFRKFLLYVLNQLQTKDTNGFFSQPVSEEDAPDYKTFITDPMDFSTMESKVQQSLYSSFDSFEHDFYRIVENCKTYNEPVTPYYKAAVRLKENTRNILTEARRLISVIGFNEAAGVHLNHHHPPHSYVPDNDRSVPQVLAICGPGEPADADEDALVAELSELRELLAKAYLQKSGGSRSKKIKTLQARIDDVNDQLHGMNPDRYPLQSEEDKLDPQKRRRNETLARRSAPSPPVSQSPKSPIVKTVNKHAIVSNSQASIYDFDSPVKHDSRRKRTTSAASDSGEESMSLCKLILMRPFRLQVPLEVLPNREPFYTIKEERFRKQSLIAAKIVPQSFTCLPVQSQMVSSPVCHDLCSSCVFLFRCFRFSSKREEENL